ncbi:hypothetical protein [Leadbettera azotonutricia]|uniref:Transporter n=1 Tax=Leadbettera azotonutricia (strain ATCC BAA-888 / DSM 13862 / ZAS-9) TaxID=545695 RepID=F5YDZ7_LEAAZ|nr:hypothetical protein [Leadbettera azotonutricia]AEF82583.1 hypothetical protein TREAZ_1559 [Leadbettera azotonutricia ZAS-9]
MKKIVSLVVLGILCGTMAIFAEDAKAMPARMGRFYLAPSFSFANQTFDKDGERQDTTDGKGAVKMFNLGFALEYGIISWITGAIQWAPGWNVWSDLDFNLRQITGGVAPSDKEIEANLKDFGDIFLGAKIQIIGPAAPVQSEMFRLAFGPGVKIPLPGPDFEDEYAKLSKDIGSVMTGGDPSETITVSRLDKHVFSFGLRSYFDYIINSHFSLNLYNEFLYYPIKAKGNKYAMGVPSSVDVAYGYDLTFEFEPHFDTVFGNAILFHAGLPVTYKTSPDVKVNGTTRDDSGMQSLSLKPNVSVFFTQMPLPLQFQLGYTLPLWGVNTPATNTIVLQIRAYFKIGSSS